MKRTLVLAAMLVGLFSVAPQAITAPEPSEVPITWEFGFDFTAPQPITVILPGQKTPTTFWYMLYTVTNMNRDLNTGRGADHNFIPEFTMFTDNGQVALSDRRLAAGVFEAIRKRHNNPLLKEHAEIGGTLKYGRDNAKDGVAIWPDFSNKTGSFDVFVGGLSGETDELKLPRPVTVTELDANGVETPSVKYKIILHKALRLNFKVKGEMGSRLYTTTKFQSKNWVLR